MKTERASFYMYYIQISKVKNLFKENKGYIIYVNKRHVYLWVWFMDNNIDNKMKTEEWNLIIALEYKKENLTRNYRKM